MDLVCIIIVVLVFVYPKIKMKSKQNELERWRKEFGMLIKDISYIKLITELNNH